MLERIVTAISEAESVDPVDLTPPLNDTVNTEALGQLLHGADETTSVTFEYRHWEVEVRGGGHVDITKLPNRE